VPAPFLRAMTSLMTTSARSLAKPYPFFPRGRKMSPIAVCFPSAVAAATEAKDLRFSLLTTNNWLLATASPTTGHWQLSFVILSERSESKDPYSGAIHHSLSS